MSLIPTITTPGDPTVPLPFLIGQGKIMIDMVTYEYRKITKRRRLYPKAIELRKNYPPVRLDINGNIRYH